MKKLFLFLLSLLFLFFELSNTLQSTEPIICSYPPLCDISRLPTIEVKIKVNDCWYIVNYSYTKCNCPGPNCVYVFQIGSIIIDGYGACVSNANTDAIVDQSIRKLLDMSTQILGIPNPTIAYHVIVEKLACWRIEQYNAIENRYYIVPCYDNHCCDIDLRIKYDNITTNKMIVDHVISQPYFDVTCPTIPPPGQVIKEGETGCYNNCATAPNPPFADNQIIYAYDDAVNPCPQDCYWTLYGNYLEDPSRFLGTTGPQDLVIKTNGTEQMRITAAGNIGIGTGLDIPTSKLDINGDVKINGTMYSTEIFVKPSNEYWPDEIFTKGYKLKSIKEIKSYIDKNGHLPDIPNKDEIKLNGLNISEMQKQLLRKIEELTLYIIDLKRENQEIKNELKNLKKVK
ncbi:MAG: hypothetical protein ABSG15_05045 [FCB group bacterium]